MWSIALFSWKKNKQHLFTMAMNEIGRNETDTSHVNTFKVCLHATSPSPCPSKAPSKFNIMSMVMDTLRYERVPHFILSVKVSIINMKSVAHKNGDVNDMFKRSLCISNQTLWNKAIVVCVEGQTIDGSSGWFCLPPVSCGPVTVLFCILVYQKLEASTFWLGELVKKEFTLLTDW